MNQNKLNPEEEEENINIINLLIFFFKMYLFYIYGCKYRCMYSCKYMFRVRHRESYLKRDAL